MILVVRLVGCFSALIIVLVRFFVRTLLFMYFWCHSGICASSVVIDFGFCGVSTTALRFSSDQLFPASRRTLRAYTIICSDKVFVCEVALSQPHAGFPSVCQLWCWISRSLSDLWKVRKNCFSKLHQFYTVRPRHDRMGTVPHHLGNEE